MRITDIKLKQECNGIRPFAMLGLGDMIILAGSNGSGKTRLLRMLKSYIDNLKDTEKALDTDSLSVGVYLNGEKITLDQSNASCISVINYSHFDAQLQDPNKFPPYVIHKAKEHLKRCDISETALNALLFIKDLAKGYSPEFANGEDFTIFQDELKRLFNLELSRDEVKNPLLFGRDIAYAAMSPGQQYLLRMAVALKCNVISGETILLLDEPETHLHSDVLIKLITEVRERFVGVQIWIATHSLQLISHYISDCSCSIFHLKNGGVNRLGSDSEELIDGLLGSETNRFRLQQFIVSPDAFASNQFAIECMYKPHPKLSKGDSALDPQAETVYEVLGTENAIVLDYGAGQGRLLQELVKCDGDIASKITYLAYDKDSFYSQKCKEVMRSNMFEDDNYYNDFSILHSKIGASVDYVFLVNVLHEIPPHEWTKVFCDISGVLKESGALVIVERTELTIGEQPYDNGFVVVTENSLAAMISDEYLKSDFCTEHCNRPIIRFSIPKKGLSIEKEDVIACLKALFLQSYEKIKEIKTAQDENVDDYNKFECGIRLAFWTHQYVNVVLNLENFGISMEAVATHVPMA